MAILLGLWRASKLDSEMEIQMEFQMVQTLDNGMALVLE